MQTYVINTSENRVFDSNFLFELVGYSNITWMYSGLEQIDECAKRIIERQNAPMADECRVVVLVDFHAFPHTLRPELEAASDYIAIYKSLIEIYLSDHLFGRLRSAHIAIGGKEIFYIQYIKKETYIINAAEQQHLAFILSLTEEAERLKEEAAKRGEPKNLSAVSDEEYARRQKEKDAEAEEKIKEKHRHYTKFDVVYEGGVLSFPAAAFYRNAEKDLAELEEGEDRDSITFANFYNGFTTRKAEARQNGIRTRTYIATGISPSRAAFDTLVLSLSLIRFYEKEGELPMAERDVDIPTINKNEFTRCIQDSYSSILAARSEAINSSNNYYALEWPIGEDPSKHDFSAIDKVELEKEDPTKRLSKIDDQYMEIRRLASRVPGKMADTDLEKMDDLMAAYKSKRDAKRESITTEEDKRQILDRARPSETCPNENDFRNVIRAHKGNLQKYLKSALAAEYVSTEYDEELKEAQRAFDKYKTAEACMTKNVVGDIIFLLLTLAVMIVPFYVLQNSELLLAKVSLVIAGVLAAAVFGGLFVLSLLLHVLPYMKRMSAAKAKMAEIYDKCLKKQAKSFAKLRRRYSKELLAIEDIRYNMRVIAFLHATNHEQSRHANAHRQMLERVKDALLGMMNSLSIVADSKPKTSSMMRLSEIFNIKEPINSKSNSVYKIFSVEAIDKMFDKRGGE